LWLNRLYTSCFKPSMRSSQPASAITDGDEKDLDADLELLMSGMRSYVSQAAAYIADQFCLSLQVKRCR
jgi:hypothetical protein